MNLIFCFIIGFIGGFFFSTAISVSDKTQDGFKEHEEKKHGEIHYCSNCGFEQPYMRFEKFKFCPSCGEKVEVTSDD